MKERLPQIVLTGILALLLGAAGAQAEHDGGKYRGHHDMMRGGPDFERVVEHMSRRLELDENQEQKIRNIIDAVEPEAAALREEAMANRKAIHALDAAADGYYEQLQNLAARNGELATKLTMLRGRVMANLSAELSDEQKARLSEDRRSMREGFRHRRHSAEPTDDTTT